MPKTPKNDNFGVKMPKTNLATHSEQAIIWVQGVTQVCFTGVSDTSQIDIYAFARCTSVDVERFLSILNAFEADRLNMTEDTLNNFFL